jgi:hypothetical protein
VVVLHQGKLVASGKVGEAIAATGEADLAKAFGVLTGRAKSATLASPATPGTRPGFSLSQYLICLKGVLKREGLRFSISASALYRPWYGRSVAVHLRRRFSAGARRVDYPALQDLCLL